jgi:hypothetical protein
VRLDARNRVAPALSEWLRKVRLSETALENYIEVVCFA